MKNGYFTGGYKIGYSKSLDDLLKKIKIHKNEFNVEIVVYRDMIKVIEKLKEKLK